MNKYNIYKLLIYSSLSFFFIILLSKTSSADHYQYEACGPINCGSGPSISFPFFIPGRQESYCGYPGFALNCSPGGFPILQLNENEYFVEQIFNQNRSFHVLDAAVLGPVGRTCFPRIENITLPSARFNYVSTTGWVYLFSGCRRPWPEGLVRYNVSNCDNWDLAIYEGDENLGDAIEICERNVVAPVGRDDEGINGNSDVTEVLRRGFALNWTASDCNECVDSGGRCGFNASNYQFRCYCPGTGSPHSWSCPAGNSGKRRVLLIASTVSGAGVLLLVGFLASFILWQRKKRRNEDYLLSRNLSFDPSSKPDVEGTKTYFGFHIKNCALLKLLGIRKSKTGKELDIELFLKSHGNLVLKRYKYSDLKKMTKSFSEKLGKGGYGSVYKGKLAGGRFVAVKILNGSKGNGQEFINEVASISRTSHINVVTLLGFCFEGSKTALVYDFMPNGSLEKYIQNNALFSLEEEGGLGWEKLFEIAIGIARGLDYLHQGCNTRILHFDIKPHNILLDKDFNPKISDFGLARLCPNRSSIVSMMVARGTIGYIAPEVFCSNFGNVSYKSDVYSYGMMVLEIAGEKKIIDRGDVDRTSETYFPQYIYNQLELMDSRVDHGIVNEDASQLAKRKLITVGLWCIQTDPKDRPSMSKVVEMLEGKTETLQVPPKPCLSSPIRSTLDFSSTSQSM